jgi:hypothetical protein
VFLQHPQVLRHMSNYVIEFGVRSTLEWRESTILGTPSREAIARLHADGRGIELLDRLHASFFSVAALTTNITVPAAVFGDAPPSPASSLNKRNASIAVRELSATRVPTLSARGLAAITNSETVLRSLKADALYSDMVRFYTGMVASGGRSRGMTPLPPPSPPPAPSAAGVHRPPNGNQCFHQALCDLHQYDATFLSSAVSAFLSVSKRFVDVDGTGARQSWGDKARRHGAGGAYHEFWLHEHHMHEVEHRERRSKQQRVRNGDGSLGISKPPSMADADDDMISEAAHNDSFVHGTHTRGTSPCASVPTPLPPMLESITAAGSQALSSSPQMVDQHDDEGVIATGAPPLEHRSMYHHPPHAISYQRTNTRLFAGSGAAHDEDASLGPNACGGTAPGSVLALRANGLPHRDSAGAVTWGAAHAQSLPPALHVGGNNGISSKLVASTLAANSEMMLDALDALAFLAPPPLSSSQRTLSATNKHPTTPVTQGSIFSDNCPESRIFIFTTDPTMAKNLLLVCSFFFRHQYPYVDVDDYLRSVNTSATTTAAPIDATLSITHANIMGHAAFPGTALDTIALFPSLPVVWVPEEWNHRLPLEQLTHRLSPDTHVVVIAPRLQMVQRLMFRKHFSTRDISLERRQNEMIVKHLPYGLSNGCFFSELVQQDTITPNQFISSTIQRALRVEARSKGVLSAAAYLEEWMSVLLQQCIVFATEGATSGRCTLAVAQAVLQATSGAGRAGSTSPGAGNRRASPLAEERKHNGLGLLTSTHSTGGNSNSCVSGADALAVFNRDLQGLLMCTEVDISHVQLLHLLAEL